MSRPCASRRRGARSRRRAAASTTSRATAGSAPSRPCTAPFAGVCAPHPTAIARPSPDREEPMQIAIPLYAGFTALDAIGPYEVLSRLPGAEVTFLAERAGPVTTDTGVLTIHA